jgi:hypothetical protein
MQCKELEAVLEHEGFSPLPTDAQEHLAACANCQALLADFTSIVATAKQIPAELAPPDRVWISLRTQLQAEGVIREQVPALVAPSTSWWQNLSAAFRPRTLATAGIGIALAAGLYLQSQKTSTPSQSAQQSPAQSENLPSAISQSPAPSGSANVAAPQSNASATSPDLSAQRANASNRTAAPAADVPLRPSPSELAATTLTTVEQDLPNMQLAGNSAVDTSLRQNLRTLNEFIAECQQRLKQNPQDALAREYLYSAYQQKAELLSAMMESGRSEH